MQCPGNSIAPLYANRQNAVEGKRLVICQLNLFSISFAKALGTWKITVLHCFAETAGVR